MSLINTAGAMLAWSVGFIAVAQITAPLFNKGTDFIGGRGA